MIMQKRVPACERYPRGYGLAWVDWLTNEGVCYPIPLNWLLCLGRKLLILLKVPPWSRSISPALAREKQATKDQRSYAETYRVSAERWKERCVRTDRVLERLADLFVERLEKGKKNTNGEG